MKRVFFIFLIVIVLSGCGTYDNGELVGVPGRRDYFEPLPYGMVYIPQGSYTMGPNDEDITWSFNSQSYTVSIDDFWMDETEITNNEYRQFVYWVRDSIVRKKLGEQLEEYLISEDIYGNEIDPPVINWEIPIDAENEEVKEILSELHYPPGERLNNRKEFDTRLLNYEYYWIDYQQAAKASNRYNPDTKQYTGEVINLQGERIPVTDRSSFIMRDVINVYPDTLCWIYDFAYSYNDPYTTMYFWHPSFDNYPIVGVTWLQARAFCIWRTNYLNEFLSRNGEPFVLPYRLPTESEWEYAARGDLDLSKYPWGGPYTRNNLGCFLANFKPLRGNYTDDGALNTIAVATYEPNDYGLYDMAGNVAEWTANAYDESAYTFIHDMNPDYKYESRPDDPISLKRKAIRGGSWKDVGYFLQNGTRTYEYQDSAKSYIGFRCVRTYLGGNTQ
ncbi:SUMF1/EgtB/PvdO family nonheme iron enzyme [Bacteroidota bacterium]